MAVYSGDKRFRDMELEKLRDGRAEVLIAAKSMFQSHSSFQPLNAIRWKLVVIDEFHTFKVSCCYSSQAMEPRMDVRHAKHATYFRMAPVACQSI